MDPVYYDKLLTELFATMEKYNTSMNDLQDHLYDCLYNNSEAERQAGFFAPQLNSSSYYGLPMMPHLYVVDPDDTTVEGEKRTALKRLVVQSVLPQLEALEKAQKEKEAQEKAEKEAAGENPEDAAGKDNLKKAGEEVKTPEDPEDEKKPSATFKRQTIQDKPEESSDDDDSGSDVDIDALLKDDSDDEGVGNNKKKPEQQKKKNKAEEKKQKVQTLPDLLRIFSVVPSPPLMTAQKEWIAFIQETLPKYYAAKLELEAVCDKVEAYKAQFAKSD